jgi:hypothetical protein
MVTQTRPASQTATSVINGRPRDRQVTVQHFMDVPVARLECRCEGEFAHKRWQPNQDSFIELIISGIPCGS